MNKYTHKALRKVIEFYTDHHKEAYRKFAEFIGGRSEQGVYRAALTYLVAHPQLMDEILNEYDKAATNSNLAKIQTHAV